jgi:hypothetical protein
MEDLICKFVVKDGEVIGESIDVYEDFLIVKIGNDFVGIPTNVITKVEKERIFVKDFDLVKGKEIGKKWIEEKSKPVSLEELEKYGL